MYSFESARLEVELSNGGWFRRFHVAFVPVESRIDVGDSDYRYALERIVIEIVGASDQEDEDFVLHLRGRPLNKAGKPDARSEVGAFSIGVIPEADIAKVAALVGQVRLDFPISETQTAHVTIDPSQIVANLERRLWRAREQAQQIEAYRKPR